MDNKVASQKRKRESEESSNEADIDTSSKQVVEEGLSWWTCMMLGVSQDKAKPQGRRVITQNNSANKHTLDIPHMASLTSLPDVCEECQSTRPATPPPESCCGSGCAVCVFDIHDQEIALWKKTCKRKHGAEQNEVVSDGSAMDLMDYKLYELENVVPVCANTAIYRFKLPCGKKMDLSLAKHIILRGMHNSKVVTRQYTPISLPDDVGFFEVLIKLYPEGDMSKYIKEWRIGDKVEWRGPFGAFTYQPNQNHYIIAIAAGTGITPIIQVMRHIVENEEDETIFRLLYTCQCYEEILLKETLNELALYWNITIIYNLTRASPGSHHSEYGEIIQYGRFTQERITKEVAASMGRRVRALVCGTRSFETDMITFLKEAGVPSSSIEKF